MLRYFSLIIVTLISLVSCKNNENTPDKTSREVDSLLSVLNKKIDTSNKKDSTLFYKKKLNEAETKYNSVWNNRSKLQKDNQDLIKIIDSLTTEINTIKTSKNKKAPKVIINKQEKKIRTLISSFLQAWDNLPQTKNTKTVTKFFAKKYRCNRISIDHDNTAQISWHTEKDFNDYIKSLFFKKGWIFKTTNLKFLDTEIKDDLYFNSTFRYSLTTYKKDELIDKSNFIVTITGKKMDNEYKIVNYSWVRFSFM